MALFCCELTWMFYLSLSVLHGFETLHKVTRLVINVESYEYVIEILLIIDSLLYTKHIVSILKKFISADVECSLSCSFVVFDLSIIWKTLFWRMRKRACPWSYDHTPHIKSHASEKDITSRYVDTKYAYADLLKLKI